MQVNLTLPWVSLCSRALFYQQNQLRAGSFMGACLLGTDGESSGGCYVFLWQSHNFSPGYGQSSLKTVRKGQSHSRVHFLTSHWFLCEDFSILCDILVGRPDWDIPLLFFQFPNCRQWLRQTLVPLKHQSTQLCWLHLSRGQTLLRYKAQLYKMSSSCRSVEQFHISIPTHMSTCSVSYFQ